ncbi:MAG: hypothetical protein JJ902_17035 [Roseibium sp.]|nr:hypothetical protein [Roseibium sp.]
MSFLYSVGWFISALLGLIFALIISSGSGFDLGAVYIVFFGISSGIYWVIAVAIIEKLCSVYIRYSDQPFFIILLSLVLLALIGGYVGLSTGRISQIFNFDTVRDVGFPALAPVGIYLMRNAGRPRH